MHPSFYKQEKLQDTFSKLVRNNDAGANKGPPVKQTGLLSLLAPKSDPRRDSLPASGTAQKPQVSKGSPLQPTPELTDEQRKKVEQNRADAIRRREENQRAVLLSQQAPPFSSPSAAQRGSPPSTQPQYGNSHSRGAAIPPRNFEPVGQTPVSNGGRSSGGAASFGATRPGLGGIKPGVVTFGKAAEPKPKSLGGGGGGAQFADSPIVHLSVENGILTIAGNTFPVKDVLRGAANRAGCKMSFSWIKSPDGSQSGLWAVDAKAEAAVMAALAGTNCKVIRTDMKLAEAELAIAEAETERAKEAYAVTGAIGVDDAFFPLGGIPEPPPLSQLPLPFAAGAYPPHPLFSQSAPGGWSTTGNMDFEFPAAGGWEGPWAQHVPAQALGPRELFAKKGAGGGGGGGGGGGAQQQPEAKKQKKGKPKAPVVSQVQHQPPPRQPLGPLAPAPVHPKGWFARLTQQQQSAYLEAQVIRALDAHSRSGDLELQTPNMLRADLEKTVGGDDLKEKMPEVRALIKAHRDRFLDQAADAAEEAAEKEQRRALFMKQPSKGSAAGAAAAQRAAPQGADDLIDLTDEDAGQAKKRRRGNSSAAAAAAAPAAAEVVDLCDSDSDHGGAPAGSGAAPGGSGDLETSLRSELEAMGFASSSVRNAVAAVGSNMGAAVDWIVNHEETQARQAQVAAEESQREEHLLKNAPTADPAAKERAMLEAQRKWEAYRLYAEAMERTRAARDKVMQKKRHAEDIATRAAAEAASAPAAKRGGHGQRNHVGEKQAGEAVYAGEFVNMSDWRGGRGRGGAGWEGVGVTTFGFDDFGAL